MVSANLPDGKRVIYWVTPLLANDWSREPTHELDGFLISMAVEPVMGLSIDVMAELERGPENLMVGRISIVESE